MGRQRGPPVPRWRQLLCVGCWWLLSLSGTALQGLRWLWRLAWYLLICYKSCWDGAFQVTEELGTALQMRLESGSEGSEEDGGSTSALESEQAGGCPARRCGQAGVSLVQRLGRAGVVGHWREQSCGARAVAEQWQRGDASEAVLGRLEALEADVRFLCTELGAEKLLWSSRFLELLQEQQGLRQRVSPPWGPQPPRSPLVPWTLMAHPSCRNARGGGTAATAPSCQGKRRTNVPVGAMERARQDAGGWNHPGSRPRAQAVFWGQRLHDRQKISSRALPRPACSAELQPFPRSRNHPGGSSRQAAASCAAQGRSQLPRAHGHPRGCLCLGTLSLVEPSKEHLPDPLQLVGSFQERRVRPLPALGDTGAMDGLQNPSAAPFTSSLAR
ncbi:uncharacterized protein LOC142093027 isoform X2 [Calonectris borealis]|uniref:uncharacterized protein LOC142093027 isoform X2 n=1 Tax=Calonectris borealis TaxID=1323832 RepID=UPI003F4C98D8